MEDVKTAEAWSPEIKPDGEGSSSSDAASGTMLCNASAAARTKRHHEPVADAQPDVHVQRFNESFYRSDPADYLTTRLQLLMLAGSKQVELAKLLEDGVAFAGVTYGPRPDRQPTESDESDLGPFLAIESQQLLHHASETALRLFLVHADRSTVPWVELSSLRSPAAFKQIVDQEIVHSTVPGDLIAYVCLGGRNRPDAVSPSDWDGAVDGIRVFLRTFGQCILDDANLYNAIKHGLGVSAGDAVALIDDHVFGHGPSVEFPECDAWDNDERSWSLTTRWLDIGQSIGLTMVAIQLIESIWKIGRFRHIGGPATDRLFFPVTLRPAQLRGADRPPMRRMSWQLLTEERSRPGPGGS